MSDAHYDVAISFLSAHEVTALKISDEFADRRSVFVYSQRQPELIGKSADGIEAFTRVFREDSRVSVILHSKGWGTAGYTRVEATAIKERAFEVGWDFLLVVCLDESRPPKWIPSVKIWYGFEKYGMPGLVAAIDHRVTELGGEARKDSLIEKAARVRRKHEFEQAQWQFENSIDGVRAVANEIVRLRALLKERVAALQPISPHLDLRFSENDQPYPSAAASSAGRSLVFYWSPQYGNVLRGAALLINEWGGPFSYSGHGGPPKIGSMSAIPDIDYAGQVVWRLEKQGEFSSDTLVDYLLARLLEDNPKDRHSTHYQTVRY